MERQSGEVPLRAAHKCHEGRVLTFEPIPPTFQTLRRNVLDNLGTGTATGTGTGTVTGDGDDDASGDDVVGRQIPARGQATGAPDAGGVEGGVAGHASGKVWAYNCGVSDGSASSAGPSRAIHTTRVHSS